MKILINGICGKMGTMLYNVAKNVDGVSVVEGVDKIEDINSKKKLYSDVNLLSDINDAKECDVVIDFSRADSIGCVLSFCRKHNIPLVIATTGHTAYQDKEIMDNSKLFPIFKSANMSEGISAVMKSIKDICHLLPDWDIEIVEKHHRNKLDAPSGTAVQMLKELQKVRPFSLVLDRGHVCKREKSDIGISSIRGGGVVGEHSVIFMTDTEMITITHTALSREVFAYGAIKAGKYILKKKKGFFTNKNLFE